MPELKIQADASEVKQATDTLNAALNAQEKRIKEVTNTVNTYNAAGDRVGSTIKGITEQGDKFSARFKKVNEVVGQTAQGVDIVVKKFKLLSIGYGRVAESAEDAAKREAASREKLAKQIETLANKAATDAAKKARAIEAAEEREAKAAEAVAQRKIRAMERANEAARRVERRVVASQGRDLGKLVGDLFQDRQDFFGSRVGGNNFRNAVFGNGGGGSPPNPFGGSDGEGKYNAFERQLLRIKNQFLFFATYRGFDFIAGSINDGVAAANKLQIQLSLIRTISQDSQQSFGKFQEDVRAVSDTSGFDINTVAQSFYDAASNQLAKGSGLKPIIQQVTDFARVTNSELPDSVNLLSSAINAYGFSTEKSEQILAQFFRTIDVGRIVTAELNNTFGRAAVLGANLGVSIEELQATLAITTQKGFTTADAMTLLTNLLIKLEKPTEATARLFERLGVPTGEAAVQTFKFTGVLQKMIDEVRSGRADVGDFFDEIRGRKQFGVFEQSIGQIQAFSDSLKDTGKTIGEYNKAKDIRGESPADYLNKEINRISNIFKVDVGDKILSVTASIFKFANSNKTLASVAGFLTDSIVPVGAALVAYTAYVAAASLYTKALTIDFAANATAAKALSGAIVAVGFGAGFAIGDYLFNLDKFDANKVKEAADAFNKFEEARANLVLAKEAAPDKIAIAFEKVARKIAEATVENNQFLRSNRVLGEQASANLKAAFDVYKKITDDNLQAIKAKVTEINAEGEKAKKNALRYAESLDSLLLQTKLKYANNDFLDQYGNPQAIAVRLEEINRLRAKADSAFRSGDPKQIDEARRYYDEIARLEVQNFEDSVDLDKRRAEANGFSGTLFVNPIELQQKLNALKGELAQKEREAGVALQRNLATTKQLEATEERRIKQLDIAFERLRSVDVTNADGNINKKFLKNEQLDRSKVLSDFDVASQFLRNAATDPQQRIALEAQIFERRKTLLAEITDIERTQALKTSQIRIEEAKKQFEAEQELNKKRTKEAYDRVLEINRQFGGKVDVLRAFNEDFREQGNFGNARGLIQPLIRNFETERSKLTPDQQFEAFQKITNQFKGVSERNKTKLPTANGLTIDQALESFQKEIQEYRRLQLELGDLQTRRQIDPIVFQEKVSDPLSKIELKIPNLGTAADNAAGAIDRLIEKLNQIVPKEDVSAEIGAAYAATGGVAGQFPGQPRGMDRYPIWAAKDEYIVNATSSRLFRPMLDAINNRRSAAYMARGGVVGDTNVGDITVNVTGGETNSQTGQVLASTLRRMIRRKLL